MAPRLCPICLAELRPETVVWRSSDGTRAEHGPVPVGLRGRLRRRARGKAAALREANAWADWYAAGHRAHCPAGNCELPQDLLAADQIVVGLVGESGSSKTHYLTVLIQQLMDGALAPFKLTVSLEPGTAARYNDFYRRLWERHEVIPASRPLVWLNQEVGERQVRHPMTLVLRNWETGHAVNLCIFDAAGEQLLSHQSQATWARHLAIAEGLLFFIDPSVLPGLRSRLPEGVGAGQAMFVTQSVLDVTSTLIRRARAVPLDGDIAGVAAALLLAKADLLDGADEFPARTLAPFDYRGQDPALIGDRILKDSYDVSGFVQAAGGENLAASAAHLYPGITFHAVSTTGCRPAGGRYEKVEPRRCLDPLLMVLWRNGVIDLGG